jgi:hypothetical protein
MINFYRPRSEACRKIKNDPNLVVLGVTVETRIPSSVADQLYLEPGKLDGIGPAYYAYAEQLELINQTMDGIRLGP